MIMIAIVGVILLLAGISIGAYYFHERDDVSQKQEESSFRQNERVNEVLDAELNLHTRKITIDNVRGTPTKINGIMLECDNGEKHTAVIDIELDSQGISKDIEEQICTKMRDLLTLNCPPNASDSSDPGHRILDYLNRAC